jgi:hypothetical protein
VPYDQDAIRISQQPVDSWRLALESVDPERRELVREDLKELWQVRKQHAELDKALALKHDVWVLIPKGFRP